MPEELGAARLSKGTVPEAARRWRPRFSLWSLLLFVLLLANGGGLWWRWEAWTPSWTLKDSARKCRFSPTLSPDGTLVAAPTDDNAVCVFNTRTGILTATLKGHTSTVYPCLFDGSSDRIATASEDGTVRVWCAASGKCLHVLQGHSATVWTAVFSPDGAMIVSASEDGSARLWNCRSGKSLSILKGHSEGVISASFSPDGKEVITRGRDETIRIWDVRSARARHVFEGGLVGRYNVDGSLVATDVGGDTAVMRRREDGSVARAPDAGGQVRIWNAQTGGCERVLQGHGTRVMDAAFSPKGGVLATAGDVTARLWDIEAGKCIRVIRPDGEGPLHSYFAHDGRRLVTVRMGERTTVWDADSGARLHRVEGSTYGPDSPLSRDGDWLASIDSEGQIHLHRRRRPEWWWGLAWLPELWLTAVFGLALVYSLYRDRRRFREEQGGAGE